MSKMFCFNEKKFLSLIIFSKLRHLFVREELKFKFNLNHKIVYFSSWTETVFSINFI